ncbi:MAG: pyridoxamine 5'-phosphate oxidase [Actinomycetota bacterium]|nr:pyridoxamine 5'-phosphate oxidase [Actinomycetota bacterium]
MPIDDSGSEPLASVMGWFDAAREAADPALVHLALATATPAGVPSLRMVLLRGLGPGGFVFYTDRSSRKASELAANPMAAAVLHWQAPRHRQVRAVGPVEPVSAAESDAYWASRPAESRRSAMASHQSSVVADLTELEARRAALEGLGEEALVRPERWGGYRLRPVEVELWEERPHRFHERVRWRRVGDAWVSERLAP